MTAGSSTPDYVIDEVEERLSAMERLTQASGLKSDPPSFPHESMKPIRYTLLALALAGAIPTAGAVELNCRGPANVESFKYAWKLRGGLSWIAGIMFPTSGVGELKTTYPGAGEHAIDSSLLITAPAGKSGFYAYESQIEASGQRTLMTYHAYSWKDKSRKERTLFDYNTGMARMHKETPEKQWDKTDRIPSGSFHDVVSAIYYLRQNAGDDPRSGGDDDLLRRQVVSGDRPPRRSSRLHDRRSAGRRQRLRDRRRARAARSGPAA